jgi:hypothetical protein
MGEEEIRPTRPTLVVSPTGCCLSKIKIKKGLRINNDRNSKEGKVENETVGKP